MVDIEKCVVGSDVINKKLTEARASKLPGEIDLASALVVPLPEFSLSLSFRPTIFTQPNFEQNKKLTHTVIKFLELTDEDDVLDLFCGIGNFSLPAAKFAKSVTGVEGVPLAITCAIQNKKSHQIENVEFQKTSVLSFLKTTNNKYNKIIIDPPRTGVGESLGLLKKLAAERIVYVSCDVRALANDLRLLKSYEVVKVQTIDMSPQTYHVETVVLLKRKAKDSAKPPVGSAAITKAQADADVVSNDIERELKASKRRQNKIITREA